MVYNVFYMPTLTIAVPPAFQIEIHTWTAHMAMLHVSTATLPLLHKICQSNFLSKKSVPMLSLCVVVIRVVVRDLHVRHFLCRDTRCARRHRRRLTSRHDDQVSLSVAFLVWIAPLTANARFYALEPQISPTCPSFYTVNFRVDFQWFFLYKLKYFWGNSKTPARIENTWDSRPVNLASMTACMHVTCVREYTKTIGFQNVTADDADYMQVMQVMR